MIYILLKCQIFAPDALHDSGYSAFAAIGYDCGYFLLGAFLKFHTEHTLLNRFERAKETPEGNIVDQILFKGIRGLVIADILLTHHLQLSDAFRKAFFRKVNGSHASDVIIQVTMNVSVILLRILQRICCPKTMKQPQSSLLKKIFRIVGLAIASPCAELSGQMHKASFVFFEEPAFLGWRQLHAHALLNQIGSSSSASGADALD